MAKEPIEYAVAASLTEACGTIAARADRVPYLLFIAMDASHMTVGEISLVAEAALDSNACHVCTWGPQCELVHDIVDEIFVIREVDLKRELPFVCTSWHTNDSLAEAIRTVVVEISSPPKGWDVTTLPRRLLIVGNVATPEELVIAVFQALRD